MFMQCKPTQKYIHEMHLNCISFSFYKCIDLSVFKILNIARHEFKRTCECRGTSNDDERTIGWYVWKDCLKLAGRGDFEAPDLMKQLFDRTKFCMRITVQK